MNRYKRNGLAIIVNPNRASQKTRRVLYTCALHVLLSTQNDGIGITQYDTVYLSKI